MSCLRFALLAYGEMGRIEVTLNYFLDVTSVIEMIFRVPFLAFSGPSDLREDSRKTQT